MAATHTRRWFDPEADGGSINGEGSDSSDYEYEGHYIVNDTTRKQDYSPRESDEIPRVVVRDHLGRVLDTNTSYQQAITKARWKRRYRLTPRESQEWRLPHSILPARPDYTRNPPPASKKKSLLQKLKQSKDWLENTEHLEQFVDALQSEREDPEFAASMKLEALQAVSPTVAAILELRSTERRKHANRNSYMQICTSAPVGDKFVSETERKEADYVFPGFCYGCRSSGMCYGCEADQNTAHVHKEKPIRTGGGFTYWKRDVPYNEQPKNHPGTWQVQYPPVPVFYEGQPYPDLEKYGLTIGIGMSGDEETKHILKNQLKNYYRLMHRAKKLHPGQEEEDEDKTKLFMGPFLVSEDSDVHYPPGYRPSRQYMSARHEASRSSGKTPTKKDLWPPPGTPWYLQKGVAEYGPGMHAAAQWSHKVESTPATSRSLQHTPSMTGSRPEEQVMSEPEDLKAEEVPAKRRNLYKPPPAFKLKARKRRSITGTSPFSTDRRYNIPTGDGFQIKKSDKELTKFIDKPSREGSLWKEPSKFSLKSRSSTGDWHLGKLTKEKTKYSHSDSDEEKDEAIVPSPVASPPRTRPSSKASVKTPVRSPIPSVHSETTDSGIESSVPVKPLPAVVKPPEVIPLPKTPEKTKTDDDDDKNKNKNKKKVQIDITSETTEKPFAPEKPPLPPIPAAPVRKEPPLIEKKPEIEKEDTTKNEEDDSNRKKRKEPPVKKVKKEVPKKVMIEAPPEPVLSEPEPSLPEEEFKSPTPPPTPPVPKRVEPPPLPALAPPVPSALPEYVEPTPPKRETSKTFLEVPPPMPEPPPQRKPPPKVRPKRPRVQKRRIVQEEPKPRGPAIKQKAFVDPLDYLAKFCIIHPDRMPHYERVFNAFLMEQQYRYADVPIPPEMLNQEKEELNQHLQKLVEEARKKKESPQAENDKNAEIAKKRTNITKEEKAMIEGSTLVPRKHQPVVPGQSRADEAVAKISYELENLIEKYDELQQKLDDLQLEKVLMVARLARKIFPEVANPGYQQKKKKGKKSKGKSKEQKVEAEKTITTNRVSDVEIVNRLSTKMLEELRDYPEVAEITLEIERLEEKLKYVDDRIEDMEAEKRIVQLYARDHYFHTQENKSKAPENNALYKKLHPEHDPELNFTEVEEALQQINGHLLTDKELQYIYHVLEIPAKRRLNLKLFSAVAALSEKVVQLEPMIRKMINKLNFEALNVKMEKVQNLFELLQQESTDVPDGMINVNSLMVELLAGGVTHDHVDLVLQRFNRDNKGIVDFLDFLIFVPLFIEIHGRIINDPFSNRQDL